MRDDQTTNGHQREPNQTPTGTEENCAATTRNTASLLWPPLPENVTVHHTVDLDTDDPTYTTEIVNAGNHRSSHRRCVAARRDGQRCATCAMHHTLLCPLHAGRLRPEDGGKARRAQRQERERHAEQVLQLQKLGTRAVVAEALVREAANVDRAVTLLREAAAKGDVQAAKALIPWIDQALGKQTEGREHTYPSSLEELEQLDEEELARLVAEGRQRRLQQLGPVPEPADWRRRSPSLGVVGDVVDDE